MLKLNRRKRFVSRGADFVRRVEGSYGLAVRVEVPRMRAFTCADQHVVGKQLTLVPARACQAVAPRGVGVAVELLVADDAVNGFHPGIGPLAHGQSAAALALSAPAISKAFVAPPVVPVKRKTLVAGSASFSHQCTSIQFRSLKVSRMCQSISRAVISVSKQTTGN